MSDDEFAAIFPSYMSEIITQVRERDWLIHNFNLEDQDLYNPVGYIYNRETEGIEYSLILDANIFQYIVNSCKKVANNQHQRDAVALIIFCQAASIEIDPTYACYEKSFRSASGPSETAEDLALFHQINNTESEQIAAYSFGLIDKFKPNTKIHTDTSFIVEKLTSYNKLRTWDSLYLITLKIVQISQDRKSSRSDKIKKFVYWSIYEFRFSLIALIFAVIAFGLRPLKNMMKYSPNFLPNENKNALENMTWDLYISSQFFEKWVEKGNAEHIFASDDRAFSREGLHNTC